MKMNARRRTEDAFFLFLPLLRQYILKELCPQFVTKLVILLQSNYSVPCMYILIF